MFIGGVIKGQATIKKDVKEGTLIITITQSIEQGAEDVADKQDSDIS